MGELKSGRCGERCDEVPAGIREFRGFVQLPVVGLPGVCFLLEASALVIVFEFEFVVAGLGDGGQSVLSVPWLSLGTS
jgi:hypothetical protein